MNIAVTTRRLPLEPPVATPQGPFSEVFEARAGLQMGSMRATGVVRCMTAEESEAVASALTDLADDLRPALAAALAAETPDALLERWRQPWQAQARRLAGDRGLLALSGLDALVWDVAWSRRRRGGGIDPGPGPSIYWSGFWLDDDPAAAAGEARRAGDAGFDGVKMRLDPEDVPGSIARFRAIAEALPASAGIAVEAAGSSDEHSIRAFVDGITPERLLWVEDPVDDSAPEVMARLSAAGIPIGTGEDCWGLEALHEHVAATRAQVPIIDLGRVGGPTGLAAFLAERSDDAGPIGIHLDARTATHALALLRPDAGAWVEVMDWWEQVTPSELRRDHDSLGFAVRRHA